MHNQGDKRDDVSENICRSSSSSAGPLLVYTCSLLGFFPLCTCLFSLFLWCRYLSSLVFVAFSFNTVKSFVLEKELFSIRSCEAFGGLTLLHVQRIQVKTALVKTVYQKSLCLSNSARQQKSVGEIVILMQVRHCH